MSWLVDILRESWTLYYLAAPFILFGVVMAGSLQVLLSPRRVVEWMGKPGMLAVVRAALLGIPLPLCSCGVFPVSISLRRKGATPPATMSFLVTTPETSADAIVLTWALLGPIMAVFRPIAAFFTGGLAGALAIAFPPPLALADDSTPVSCGCRPSAGSGSGDTSACCDPGLADGGAHDDHDGHDHSHDIDGSDFVGFRATGRALLRALHIGRDDARGKGNVAGGGLADDGIAVGIVAEGEAARGNSAEGPSLSEILSRIGRQAFIRSMDDIVFWLTIGLVLAGAIEVLLPPDLIARGLGSGILPMLLIVVIAVPMYTCASSSTPVAAALIAKGLSPGAALVFLLAGPAASTASMLLITRHFGAKFLRVYLSAVVVGSVISGLALDFLLARTGWKIIPQLSSQTEGFVAFLQLIFVVFLTGLIAWRLWAGGARVGIGEARENWDALVQILRSSRKGPSAHTSAFRVSGRVTAVLVVALLLVQIGRGFVVVPPDSFGYAKVFGRIVGRDLAPGLHWNWPSPLGTVDVWRVQYPRKSDIGFQTSLDLIERRKELRRQAAPNEWHSPVTAMNANTSVTSYLTGDENLVELSFTVHYFLSDPYAFFYSATKDRDWVGLYAESAARELVATRDLDQLLTAERAWLESSLAQMVQERLDALAIGVRVNSVHVVDLHPPQGAVTAFRDVSTAREERQTRIHKAYEVQERELPLARGAGELDMARERADAIARVSDARGRSVGYRARSTAYRTAPSVLHDLLWFETAEEVLANRPKIIVPPNTRLGNVTLWKLEPPLPTQSQAVETKEDPNQP
ncbi:MAG: SO_0444 family Cu/Zn efflux transporter [Candidatus Eisenbacteria bacterium]